MWRATPTAAPESDSQLLDRARAGDAGAFCHLVSRYQQLAFRVAYLVSGAADRDAALRIAASVTP